MLPCLGVSKPLPAEDGGQIRQEGNAACCCKRKSKAAKSEWKDWKNKHFLEVIKTGYFSFVKLQHKIQWPWFSFFTTGLK